MVTHGVLIAVVGLAVTAVKYLSAVDVVGQEKAIIAAALETDAAGVGAGSVFTTRAVEAVVTIGAADAIASESRRTGIAGEGRRIAAGVGIGSDVPALDVGVVEARHFGAAVRVSAAGAVARVALAASAAVLAWALVVADCILVAVV